jgi:RNA polymerase sigma-70 factor (sigma-E family)
MADDGFGAFVEQRYAHLLRIAYLLTGSQSRAEDLLQSALLATLSRWRRMEQPEAYVRRVMVNHLASQFRRRRVVEVLTAVLPDRAATDPATDPDSGLRDELWQALGRLPARMRAVLVLRYWEDMSEAETAELLGVSVGTVKSQASRGLARLRELVGDANLTGDLTGELT